jgi:tetratricopeptide (TPR) repeat protein
MRMRAAMRRTRLVTTLGCAGVRILAFAAASSVALPTVALAADAPMPAVRKRREPPPAVIPTDEVKAAQKLYDARNYQGAVVQAKAALNKNERYTPAMLIMAKAYFKLGKNEWVRTLGDMMKNAGASEAERSEIYQMLAFMEIDKKNTPGAIEQFKKATDARPDNAIAWNNLGAQYLVVKNYREAVPVLERSVHLQPTFTKAHLNLGSAYRGAKQYDKALAEYKQALALFPRYADAVYNLGILFLDAEKMPNMDTTAKLNTAINYLQQYKQMVTGAGQSVPAEADAYLNEAQEDIKKEQKRIERQKKQEERDRQRAAKKAADDAKKPAAPPAAPGPAPAGYPAAPSNPAGYPAAPTKAGAQTPPAGWPAPPARTAGPAPAPSRP